MTDWTNEEEEAFNDVEKHSNLGKQILRLHFDKKSWTDLTHAEIGEIYRAGWANNMDFAEAIQKALREKNT